MRNVLVYTQTFLAINISKTYLPLHLTPVLIPGFRDSSLDNLSNQLKFLEFAEGRHSEQVPSQDSNAHLASFSNVHLSSFSIYLLFKLQPTLLLEYSSQYCGIQPKVGFPIERSGLY